MGAKTGAAAGKLAAQATALPAAIAPLLQGTTHSVRWLRGAPGITQTSVWRAGNESHCLMISEGIRIRFLIFLMPEESEVFMASVVKVASTGRILLSL